MTPPRGHVVACLDAMELVPAGVRDVLLSLADVGVFRPVWSAHILDEVRRVIHEIDQAKSQPYTDCERLFAEMRRAFPDAEDCWPEYSRRSVSWFQLWTVRSSSSHGEAKP